MCTVERGTSLVQGGRPGVGYRTEGKGLAQLGLVKFCLLAAVARWAPFRASPDLEKRVCIPSSSWCEKWKWHALAHPGLQVATVYLDN